MSGKSGAVDFGTDVSEWPRISENDQSDTVLDKVAFLTEEQDPFAEAKMEELKNWTENDVFERVEDQGQLKISTRWALTEKKDGRRKARLVARGFLEKNDPH